MRMKPSEHFCMTPVVLQRGSKPTMMPESPEHLSEVFCLTPVVLHHCRLRTALLFCSFRSSKPPDFASVVLQRGPKPTMMPTCDSKPPLEIRFLRTISPHQESTRNAGFPKRATSCAPGYGRSCCCCNFRCLASPVQSTAACTLHYF